MSKDKSGGSKRIKSALFQEGADEELVSFAQDYFARLSSANSHREMFEREEGDRRLEAMARLIVGDEVCAAVGYDGTNFLISSNSNDHRHTISFRIALLEKAGSTRENMNIQFIYYLAFDDGVERRIPGEIITYRFDSSSGIMKPDSPLKNFTITPEMHLVPYLPAIDMGIHKRLAESLPPPPEDYYTPDDHESEIPSEVRQRTGIIEVDYGPSGEIMGYRELIRVHKTASVSKDNSFNPFKYRAEKMLEHMQKYAAHIQESRDEEAVEAKEELDQERARLFENALSWEAATWYNKKFRDFHSFNENAKQINELMKVLQRDFSQYKLTHGITWTTSSDVRDWATIAVHKFNKGLISAPDFITKNPVKFMAKALRYFIDVEKLEKWVDEQLDLEKHPLLDDIMYKVKAGKTGDFVKIVDADLEDGVHAELRLGWHSTRPVNSPLNFIAVSMLCCASCHLLLDDLEIAHYGGTHAKSFGDWPLPESFVGDERFLRSLLGDRLYERYQAFTPGQQKSARDIIMYIGALDQSDLVKLDPKFRILFNNLPLLHDESDDEYEEKEYVFVHPRFEADEMRTALSFMISSNSDREVVELHRINPDGNCMYNTAVEGIRRIPADLGNVLLDNGNEVAVRDLTQVQLRSIVADELTNNLHQYIEQLETQLVDGIRRGDVRGFIGEERERILALFSARQEAITESNQDRFDQIEEEILNYVVEELRDTYVDMVRLGVAWGDEVELGILSARLGVQLQVHRRDGVPVPVINNAGADDAPVVHLDYDGRHYNLILNYPTYLQEEIHETSEGATDVEQENVTDSEPSSYEQAFFYMATGGKFFDSWDFS